MIRTAHLGSNEGRRTGSRAERRFAGRRPGNIEFLELFAVEQKHHRGTGGGTLRIHRTAEGGAAGATQVGHRTFPLGKSLRERDDKSVRASSDGHTDMKEPHTLSRRQIRIVEERRGDHIRHRAGSIS